MNTISFDCLTAKEWASLRRVFREAFPTIPFREAFILEMARCIEVLRPDLTRECEIMRNGIDLL